VISPVRLAERGQRDGQDEEATDNGLTEMSFDASYE